MRKVVLALLLSAVLTSSLPVQASVALDKYPETCAVLQLLHNDGIKAARTYSAYARKAHSEEQFNIESFFVAMAVSELIRAEAFAKILKDMDIRVAEVEKSEVRVSSTKFNLQLMTNIESANIEKKFEWLIKTVKPEGHAVAIAAVKHTWQVEIQHRDLAKDILSSLKAFLGIAARIPDEFLVCQSCGSTTEEMPDLTCPICQGPISDYEKASAKWQFYSCVEENVLLDDKEKAYAKRMFDYIYAQVNDDQDVELDGRIYYTPVYRKWGLGPEREFSLEEKLFLVGLDETAQMWEEYNSIDVDNLGAADKEFLKQTHEKYGPGPIDLRHERIKEMGSLSEEAEKILDIVEVVSARSEFEDRDLVFLRNRVTAAARGI